MRAAPRPALLHPALALRPPRPADLSRSLPPTCQPVALGGRTGGGRPPLLPWGSLTPIPPLRALAQYSFLLVFGVPPPRMGGAGSWGWVP
jgi:hypothetical protein